MRKKLNKKGFTLVEIIGVVAILGIVSVVGLVSVNSIIQKGKQEHYVAAEKNLKITAESYAQANREYLQIHRRIKLYFQYHLLLFEELSLLYLNYMHILLFDLILNHQIFYLYVLVLLKVWIKQLNITPPSILVLKDLCREKGIIIRDDVFTIEECVKDIVSGVKNHE